MASFRSSSYARETLSSAIAATASFFAGLFLCLCRLPAAPHSPLAPSSWRWARDSNAGPFQRTLGGMGVCGATPLEARWKGFWVVGSPLAGVMEGRWKGIFSDGSPLEGRSSHFWSLTIFDRGLDGGPKLSTLMRRAENSRAIASSNALLLTPLASGMFAKIAGA